MGKAKKKQVKLKANKYGNPPQTIKVGEDDYDWFASGSTKTGADDQASRFKRKWSRAKTKTLPFKKSGGLKWVVYGVRSPKKRRRK